MNNVTFLLYFTCGLAVVNTLTMAFLWRRLCRARDHAGLSYAAAQRLDREMSQHRYALAMLRQLYNHLQGNTEINKTDDELIEVAVEQLDEIVSKETNSLPHSAAAAKPISEASIKGLNDHEILQFIKQAVQDNSLTLHQQPIVGLPSREIKYYEVFARILVDKGYIPAKNFVAVAKSNNLMWAIDNLLLLRCLQLLNKNQEGLEKELFINVSSQTFSNKKYMQELVNFMATNPKLSSRLIFEMTQEESIKLNATTRQVMENLSLLGCRFSMDQVTFLGLDMNRMLDQHISFVKLDAHMLVKESEDTAGRKRIKKIKNTLDSQGITVILEKVENEKQLFSIIDLHADYGQGYLFGAPLPVP